jgi:murein DD-endopeptidase MepM/ murein hydrolase activator NlpD
MENGNLAYDGDGWLKDSNGNYILDENKQPIGAHAVEGGLLKIFKLEDNSENRTLVQKMMKDAGMTELASGTWWNHDGNNGKAITLGDAEYAVIYGKELHGYNTLKIYNDLVEGEQMAHTAEYEAFKETARYKVANIFGLGDKVAELFGVEKYISYDEYKANNFITEIPAGYQTRDTFSGFDVTTLIGASGTAANNPHRGTDAATPKGTDALQLLFNDTSQVVDSSKGKIETDKNSPQGLHVTTSTSITYNFKGKEREDVIYYRIMHLSEAAVDKGGQLAWDTVLGKTGNTGQLPTIKTYGYHAHEDIYTASIPSPFLDYLTGSTSNAAQRLYYRPEDRFFYDKFIFANRTLYSFRGDAGTYNAN